MKIPKNVTIILNSLRQNDFEAFLVGGCVRDYCLGKQPHDYDITTNATPDEVSKVFSLYKVIKTGLKHGTVSVLINKELYEITTFRVEKEYLDYRHPSKVEFVRNLAEDLNRRDFTINAMAYYDKIIDLHNGLEDIKHEIIRCVGDANIRFNEDALRILRALRFSSELGFRIEENTKTAIFNNAHLLKNISYERIQLEFNRILCGKDSYRVLKEYAIIFMSFIPELKVLYGFDQKNSHHKDDLYIHTIKTVSIIKKSLILKLAAFFHDFGKPETCIIGEDLEAHYYGHEINSSILAKKIMRSLKYSNKIIKEVCIIIEYHMRLFVTSEKSLKKVIKAIGYERILNVFEMIKADRLSLDSNFEEYDELKKMVMNLKKNADAISLNDLKVNGKDLIAIGYKSNKRLGEVLNLLLNEVVEEKIKNEKADLIKKSQELLLEVKENEQ